MGNITFPGVRISAKCQFAGIGQRAAVQNDRDPMTATGVNLAKPTGTRRNYRLNAQYTCGIPCQKSDSDRRDKEKAKAVSFSSWCRPSVSRPVLPAISAAMTSCDVVRANNTASGTGRMTQKTTITKTTATAPSAQARP